MECDSIWRVAALMKLAFWIVNEKGVVVCASAQSVHETAERCWNQMSSSSSTGYAGEFCLKWWKSKSGIELCCWYETKLTDVQFLKVVRLTVERDECCQTVETRDKQSIKCAPGAHENCSLCLDWYREEIVRWGWHSVREWIMLVLCVLLPTRFGCNYRVDDKYES